MSVRPEVVAAIQAALSCALEQPVEVAIARVEPAWAIAGRLEATGRAGGLRCPADLESVRP